MSRTHEREALVTGLLPKSLVLCHCSGHSIIIKKELKEGEKMWIPRPSLEITKDRILFGIFDYSSYRAEKPVVLLQIKEGESKNLKDLELLKYHLNRLMPEICRLMDIKIDENSIKESQRIEKIVTEAFLFMEEKIFEGISPEINAFKLKKMLSDNQALLVSKIRTFK